jgi:hypothetical protein
MPPAGLPIAEVRTVQLDSWHAPDVFDATDSRALWQHAEPGPARRRVDHRSTAAIQPGLSTITLSFRTG